MATLTGPTLKTVIDKRPVELPGSITGIRAQLPEDQVAEFTKETRNTAAAELPAVLARWTLCTTYAVHHIPYAWIEQTRPGGIILTPWGTGLYNGVLLRLTVQPDGTASGPVIDDTSFMWDRSQAPDRDVMDTVHDRPHAAHGRSPLDPRNLLGEEDAAFTAGLLMPGCRYTVGHGDDGDFTLWLADTGTGSWASIDYSPGSDEFESWQHGPRALWGEAEHAHRWWTRHGSPARTRYGLTVTPDGQYAWLDTPEHTVAASR